MAFASESDIAAAVSVINGRGDGVNECVCVCVYGVCVFACEEGGKNNGCLLCENKDDLLTAALVRLPLLSLPPSVCVCECVSARA